MLFWSFDYKVFDSCEIMNVIIFKLLLTVKLFKQV